MADLDPTSRKLARRLAYFTVQAGENAAGQVTAALQRLVGDRPLAERRAFIKVYLNDLRREISANQLAISHAGPLSEDMVRDIANAFSARSGRSFSVVTEEKPELIGGFRLTQGDNVYDASIAGRLERLAASGI